MSTENILQIFTKIMIIFLVLPIHEFAHAWTAHKFGDDTAAYSGRLTVNPLAHIDIVGALCLLFSPFGWAKPVPINPLKFKKQRLGVAVTAAAGPISNLLFAFVVTLAYRIMTSMSFFVDYIEQFRRTFINADVVINDPLGASTIVYNCSGKQITYLAIIFSIMELFIVINIGLAVFNLIPIPPLDGSKILMYFTSAKFDKWFYEHQLIVNVVFLGIVVTGILSTPISIASQFIIKGLFFITGFIPALMGA